MNAIEAVGLGKRFGDQWALRECTLSIPQGRVVALVGPNGAGKTTFLRLAVGLSSATAGDVAALGYSARAQTSELLPHVGFLAQERPLYDRLTVEQQLCLGAHLNPCWDEALARVWLARLDVPLDRRIRGLSGGQRAHVALAMVLAKRAQVLLLDEPLANLDPVARREFLSTLMKSAAEQALTIIFSSHVLAELERFCDYLVLLRSGRVRLAGDIDRLLDDHHVISSDLSGAGRIERLPGVVNVSRDKGNVTAIVRGAIGDLERFDGQPASLEDLVIAYMSNHEPVALPRPTLVEN